MVPCPEHIRRLLDPSLSASINLKHYTVHILSVFALDDPVMSFGSPVKSVETKSCGSRLWPDEVASMLPQKCMAVLVTVSGQFVSIDGLLRQIDVEFAHPRALETPNPRL